MNRAWIALAGLAALGAAGLAVDRYLPSSVAAREAVAERVLTAVQCRRIESLARSTDEAIRVGAEFVVAKIAMTGLCGRQDVERAHALFAESIGRRIGDFVFAWYYVSVDEIGDEVSKARLLIPAAAAIVAAPAASFPIREEELLPPEPYGTELVAMIERMRTAISSQDPAVTLEMIRFLADREFSTRHAERQVLFDAVMTLKRTNPLEGHYWDAHARRTGRSFAPRSIFIFRAYSYSARCAHTAAIRERAQFWLDGNVEIAEADRAHVVASVARLHERSGEEQALLGAVVAKSGLSPERALSGEFFPLIDIDNPSRCRP